MKKILFIILIFLVLGCNDESKKIIRTDQDVDRDQIIAVVESEELGKEDGKDLEPEDFEEIPEDNNSDEIDNEKYPDEDISVVEEPPCPPLREANFPYYDKEGNMHFCRECDTPAADDPRCVRNLWDEPNKKYAKAFPKRDCHPYPCVVEGLKPVTNKDGKWIPMTECDICVNPNMEGVFWGTGVPYHKHFGFSDGKIGFMMHTDISTSKKIYNYPTDHRVFEYDVYIKGYRIIMPSDTRNMAYYKGNVFSLLDDYSKIYDENSFMDAAQKRYLIYYDKNKGYSVAHDKPIRFVAFSSYMNDKWVYAVIQETDDSPSLMSYAKIGEWKWHNLGKGLDYFVSFGGDYMGTNDQDGNGYVCDLTKYPKSYSDCKKINRQGENVDNIEFDQNNHNSFVYRSGKPGRDQILVVAKIEKQGSDINFTYKDIAVTASNENVYTFAPEGVINNTIWYREMLNSPNSSDPDSKICYYKINENKRLCSMPPDSRNLYNHGGSIMSGDYIARQSFTGPNLTYRDLKCYCNLHPDVCPLENSKKK